MRASLPASRIKWEDGLGLWWIILFFGSMLYIHQNLPSIFRSVPKSICCRCFLKTSGWLVWWYIRICFYRNHSFSLFFASWLFFVWWLCLSRFEAEYFLELRFLAWVGVSFGRYWAAKLRNNFEKGEYYAYWRVDQSAYLKMCSWPLVENWLADKHSFLLILQVQSHHSLMIHSI